MYLEVKQFPGSQKVMDDPNWFFITDGLDSSELGHSAYARILTEEDLKKIARDRLVKDYLDSISEMDEKNLLL